MRPAPVLLLLLALMGCASSQHAGRLDPIPLPMAPVRPAAAIASLAPSRPAPSIDPTSDAAILQAVQDFAAAMTQAAHESRIESLLDITTPTCGCRGSFLDQVRKQIARKATSTIELRAQDARITGRRSDAARVVFYLTQAPFEITEVDGRRTPFAADREHLAIDFIFQSGRWVADYMTRP